MYTLSLVKLEVNKEASSYNYDKHVELALALSHSLQPRKF